MFYTAPCRARGFPRCALFHVLPLDDGGNVCGWLFGGDARADAGELRIDAEQRVRRQPEPLVQQ